MTNNPIKVLMIEDDKFLCDLAAKKFSKEGFHVLVAMEGRRGIELAEKELPDVVLIDILLPGLDGFEVLKRLRRNPSFDNTRLIVLSNYGQAEELEKARALGADQFLIKADFTLDDILDAIKKVLASPRKYFA